jgi:hypothetical protein
MWKIRKMKAKHKEIGHKLKKFKYNEAVHKMFIDFKKACDSVRKAVLCNILIKFDIHMKLVRIMKMCHSETCSRII